VECRPTSLNYSGNLTGALFTIAVLTSAVVDLEEVGEISQFTIDRLKIIQCRATRLYRLGQYFLDGSHQ
jgi:hypothetical protein